MLKRFCVIDAREGIYAFLRSESIGELRLNVFEFHRTIDSPVYSCRGEGNTEFRRECVQVLIGGGAAACKTEYVREFVEAVIRMEPPMLVANHALVLRGADWYAYSLAHKNFKTLRELMEEVSRDDDQFWAEEQLRRLAYVESLAIA